MMEYEEHHYGYNTTVIIVILIGFFIFNTVYHPFESPKIEPVNNPLINNTVYIDHIVTILVTPIPDGNIYYAGEYMSGVRKLQRPFSFIRNNASGYQTMKFTERVYDYKIFNKVHWFNPIDYKYYTLYPSYGNDFLFIFVNIYLDDVIGKDTRMNLPDKNTFLAQIGDRFYSPYIFQEQIRFAELENTYNWNDDFRTKAYGQIPLYSSDKKYASSAGEYSKPLDTLYGGKSNAEDGYIVYEIPSNINPEDIYIVSNLGSYGKPAWRLLL